MTSHEKLIPVREAHRFDEDRLAEYLTAGLAGFKGPLRVQQFEGGQSNPTFLLSTAGKQYVLRKKPPGRLLPSAHMVEREYRIMKSLAETGVPLPRMYLLCENPTVIGVAFFVMEYIRGRVLRDLSLPEMSAKERRAVYLDMIRVLAALHSLDFAALGLADYGKPGNYFGRQIGRWSRQYAAAKTDEIPSMERLMQSLPGRVPEDDATCIVHGDYRMENMLFHPTKPRVTALLDWELSTLGHPLADLAYTCIPFRLTAAGNLTPAGNGGPQSGIPTEEEFIAEYCRHTGRRGIPHWNFYLAFSFFRLSSIVQGVYKRGLMGNASSAEALEKGRMARQFADIAWSLIEE